MNAEQFSELMECLRGMSDRLDDIEKAVSDVSFKTPEYTAYTLQDVVERLREIEVAVTIVAAKTPEYDAYTHKDVVAALWEVEKAIRKMD